jgi:hypothetical protein
MSELVLPESSRRSYETIHFAPAQINDGVLYAYVYNFLNRPNSATGTS